MRTNLLPSQKLQGLGLSICKAIVKLLDGKIWLDEQYTEGSRFFFELPEGKGDPNASI